MLRKKECLDIHVIYFKHQRGLAYDFKMNTTTFQKF